MGENLGGHATHTYWDTDTSGATQGVAFGDASGITALTSEELKSGLPKGFDPLVWAQKKKINSGFPYLSTTAPKWADWGARNPVSKEVAKRKALL